MTPVLELIKSIHNVCFWIRSYSRAAAAERNKELGGGGGENKIGHSIPPPITNKQ